MSTRYGDRGSGRYGDSDEDRTENRDYERETDRGYGEYGTRSARGGEYGTPARGYASGRSGGDYGRGYDREYGTRDYGSRDYGSRQDTSRYGASRYGREGLTGGRAGAPPIRRREGDDYGRDYIEQGYSRDYGHDRERGHAREQGDERGDGDDVRSFDTDYGRTTSRFYGRTGYDYGRDDYDEREGMRPGYGGRAYGRRDDEHDPRSRDERDARGRGGRGWWDRAADEVLSWFGGEGDERRRPDDPRAPRGEGKFRGRGPKNYRRSDERIREEVGDRLTDSEWLDASDVEVNVIAGEVILSGTVDSRYAKRLAEDIAESVSGVAHVQNNLRVPGRQATEPGAPATTDATLIGTSDGTTATDAIATDATDIPPTGASKAAGRS
ncbi:MAG: hypothetical protein QOE46_872 [Acidobacteriota bacterium]|jgi:osmotically-inducible protein OsmY|nr:hypothetical protein [Acidobacteriota bacterium]